MLWIPTAPALALAAWALLMAALGRPPGRVQFIGTIVVTAAVVVFTIVKVSSGGGHWNALFVGYTLTALLLPPAAWIVAKLEPTRYGSMIVGFAALVVPVLALRMGQVWVAS
jgi:hypothetical protein